MRVKIFCLECGSSLTLLYLSSASQVCAVVHHKACAMRWKRQLGPYVETGWFLREKDFMEGRRTRFVVRSHWWHIPENERTECLGMLNGFLATDLSHPTRHWKVDRYEKPMERPIKMAIQRIFIMGPSAPKTKDGLIMWQIAFRNMRKALKQRTPRPLSNPYVFSLGGSFEGVLTDEMPDERQLPQAAQGSASVEPASQHDSASSQHGPGEESSQQGAEQPQPPQTVDLTASSPSDDDDVIVISD